MTDYQKRLIAATIAANPVWREFKDRYDGNIPRRNSKAFLAYVELANRAQRSNQDIVDNIISEFPDKGLDFLGKRDYNY